ncbi:MAG: RCC1 domain-containing protein [Gemmatimonadales bacterium]
MNPRPWIAVAALLLPALGCRDQSQSPTEPLSPTPQPNLAVVALTFRQVSGGGFHTCGVTTTNQAYCWGYNQYGQLGTGTATGPQQCNGADGPFPCSTKPVPVAGGLHFLQVSAGLAHTCGVATDHRIYCWGGNDGRLGNGTTDNRPSPVAVAGDRQFRQVAAGYYHSCAVTTGARAFCWGSNAYGQLGDGTTVQRLTPVAVSGGRSFRQVSVSFGTYDFSCGATTDNRGFCWGNNDLGQVGDSSSARRRLKPTAVAGGHQFLQIDAGFTHVCGVTTGHRAFCWGNGRNGEIGNGKTYLSFWPRAVAGGLFFERVTAGSAFTCAETTTNQGYCWGLNTYGQVGDGTTTQHLTPVAVAGGHFFEQLTAGDLHTCGIASGAAYCWGYGFFGQLGNGTSSFGAQAHSPVAVSGPS